MNYYWPVKAMKSMKRGMMMNELKVKKVLQSLLWRWSSPPTPQQQPLLRKISSRWKWLSLIRPGLRKPPWHFWDLLGISWACHLSPAIKLFPNLPELRPSEKNHRAINIIWFFVASQMKGPRWEPMNLFSFPLSYFLALFEAEWPSLNIERGCCPRQEEGATFWRPFRSPFVVWKTSKD